MQKCQLNTRVNSDILLAIYGLGIEAVQEPVGVRLDAPVSLAMQKQRKQSMVWVVGVFNSFLGLPFTPPDTEGLDGRELGPSDVLDRLHHHALGSRAVHLPYQVVIQPVKILLLVQL